MPELTIQQAFDLALRYHQAGNLAEAEAIYREILVRQPNSADALHLMGLIAAKKGNREFGIELIKRAISINPKEAGYYVNLGIALQALGRSNDAVAAYYKAIKLQPSCVEAFNNLGAAMLCQDRFDEAAVVYREALRINPDHPDAYEGLGIALKHQGHIEESLNAFRKCLQINPDLAQVHSSLVHSLNFYPDFDARAIYQQERQWNQIHAAPFAKFIRPHINDHDPERRLRIGYVSPDFYAQTGSLIVTPLFESHDHQHFAVYCYASVKRPDQHTDRLRRSADIWRDVLKLSDEELARQIYSDQIDILIDLSMHMANNRLLVFARKPAPVQVTWLAYPGSTGLDAIDYRLSDPYLDPPETDLSIYSEQTVRLPNCFWCYNPFSDSLPRPAQQNGPMCFGSLNHPCKLNDGILSLWSKVLTATTDSRILMLTISKEHQDHIRGVFARSGVDPKRLMFVGRSPRADYLQLYNRVDIVLDTFPYNGHTTTLDSLWMGVPVVTLSGEIAVSRGANSILKNAGLPELIARTADEYVDIAVKLANDLPRLTELRGTLRRRLESSPLMDSKRFARNVEDAYRQMWRKWCGSR